MEEPVVHTYQPRPRFLALVREQDLCPSVCGAAENVPTFVRVHHPVHNLHCVITLQLQGHVPHCIYQLCEEVCNLSTVLKEHIAVLAVGEVGVTQVCTGEGESNEDAAKTVCGLVSQASR